MDITVDDIRQWREELKKWIEVRANAEVQIAECKKNLRAAMTRIFGKSIPALLYAEIEEPVDEGGPTMRKGIKAVLQRTVEPLRHAMIKAELRKHPRLRALLKETSYYYSTMGRMVSDGEIAREGQRFALVRAIDSPSEAALEQHKTEVDVPIAQ